MKRVAVCLVVIGVAGGQSSAVIYSFKVSEGYFYMQSHYLHICRYEKCVFSCLLHKAAIERNIMWYKTIQYFTILNGRCFNHL